MEINKKKFQVFLEVAKALNTSFGFPPILYASLGLNRVIGEFGQADDIDIMVPDDYLSYDLERLVELMTGLGFKLKEDPGNEFIKGDEIIAITKESELTKLAGVDPDSLEVAEVDGARFRELSPRQYQTFYQHLLDDPERLKHKKDQLKLLLIDNFLQSK